MSRLFQSELIRLLCGFKVYWGTKSSSNLNPTALAYSSIVDSFGDIFECTFSRREILLFCVCSLLASSSQVKPAFLRRPINFFLRCDTHYVLAMGVPIPIANIFIILAFFHIHHDFQFHTQIKSSPSSIARALQFRPIRTDQKEPIFLK